MFPQGFGSTQYVTKSDLNKINCFKQLSTKNITSQQKNYVLKQEDRLIAAYEVMCKHYKLLWV